MEQRVSLITLAVADVEKARGFYRAMGWDEVDSPDGIVVFDLLSQSLGLYPIAELAKDMGVDQDVLGHGAMTLSYNGRNRAEVDAVMAAAAKAGAEVLKEPQEVFWGGYGGYFRDLDGHIWEVTFNPFAPLRRDGAFCWDGH
ncbi:VOC family protein [Epibacterium sp. SM1979]|uniref:VOC family protein n=1 Tax=Tritonibacter litoralis TaxID=2662264 RepID=A0A843YJC8_9RHOB|nr:VOC family protein [Tritonibacter litoralis]MQQ09908.1 VOC family protein [Tritonibacter litoralis]